MRVCEFESVFIVHFKNTFAMALVCTMQSDKNETIKRNEYNEMFLFGH